jgi:hypothetical protein
VVRTHYDVLGVAEDADPDVIKRAYYDRARIYHPDAHMRSSVAVRTEAERSMQTLNAAWSVLRNPAARRRYDRQLHRAPADGSPRRSTGGSAATKTRTEPRAAIGAGFQYWLGTAGSAGSGLNLRALGGSLAALRPLAPNGLVGLHAEGTTVGDRELEHLQGMVGLRFLDLSATRVTDAGLVHLLGCTNLEWLVLWETAITDDGLALVGRLPNLCHLGIGNTRVTDAGLRHLGGLGRLRLLQLWGTDVQGPGLAALHRLPALRTVTVPWRVRGGHRRRLRTALGAGATVV